MPSSDEICIYQAELLEMWNVREAALVAEEGTPAEQHAESARGSATARHSGLLAAFPPRA